MVRACLMHGREVSVRNTFLIRHCLFEVFVLSNILPEFVSYLVIITSIMPNETSTGSLSIS
jgi:hypothetical protein